MKSAQNISFVLLTALLVSCQGYHHITTTPAVPEFQKAGQIDGGIATSFNRFNFQLSGSITKHFGLYYNGYRANKSAINEYGLLAFGKFDKQKRIGYFASIGYNKGHIHSTYDENGVLQNAGYTDIYTYQSNFESYKGHLGLQIVLSKKPHFELGLYGGFQSLQFFQISTDYEIERPSSKNFVSSYSTGTLGAQAIHSTFCFTYYLPGDLAYFRYTTSFSKLNRTEVDGTKRWDYFNPNYSNYEKSTLPIKTHPLSFSLTIGVHFDALSLFKKN